jgi:DNA adenine methylase
VPHLGDVIHDYLIAHKAQYVEPFLGGAAMAAYLGWPYAILGDAIEDLVNLYHTVQDSPAELAWVLSGYAVRGVDKDAYLQIRDLRPEGKIQRAARMVYLNRLNFNGLWRVNKKGVYNVPYGDAGYRASVVNRRSRDAITSLFPHKGKFEALSDALSGASILHTDFQNTISYAAHGGERALIYVDPPYHGVYDSYTAEGFSEEDQERLAEELYYAHKRGADIIFHNANTDLIQYLYKDWLEVIPVDEKRPIAADPSSRQAAPCIVATTRPELLRAFTS